MAEEQLITLSINNKKPLNSGFGTWKKMWKKKSVTERVVLWIMFAIFVVYGFSLVFPLIWALINSFKPGKEFDLNQFALPKAWTLNNYIAVFTELDNGSSSILESIWNSIWMSTVSTLLGLAASCLTSYVVAKYKFKASGFIYAAVIFIQVIPLVGSTTGMYQLIHNTLDIANKPWAIWPIWFGGFGFSFLMLYSGFKSVSWSYAESAFIDGASHLQTFTHIMLPAVKPVLASLFVVNFISAWGDYMTAYLYMDEFPPLALAVYTMADDATRINYPAYLAVIIISVLPTIILFISFQKLIMENTNAGGLKG